VSWLSKRVDFITLFVEDLDRTKLFYQDVFGLPLLFEDENSAVFRFENTGINLLKVPAAHDLPDPLPGLRGLAGQLELTRS
jgi:catechol 2,3-dioxygenase-like lactoylglutathione lyase family enzyme